MNTDRISELRKEWEAEEKVAHIHGWDFSHIHGRYEEEDDLPWDYKKIIDEFLLPDPIDLSARSDLSDGRGVVYS